MTYTATVNEYLIKLQKADLCTQKQKIAITHTHTYCHIHIDTNLILQRQHTSWFDQTNFTHVIL